MSISPTLRAQFSDEQTPEGSFQRQADEFRDQVSSDPICRYQVEAGRYHLYISLACPWAHRTMIVRHLKGLDKAIGLTVVDPVRDEKGWAFRNGPGHTSDPINSFRFLKEAYLSSDRKFQGRVTVPVLWDKKKHRIVNNSEDDICRMFNGSFSELNLGGPDLFPKEIEEEHSKLAAFIYEKINNGVYKAGFATTQEAYETPCRELFSALDEMEKRLSEKRYLFGNKIVEADWRLFCTLVRFDLVYHGHFKCNIHRISEYPNLQGYLMDLYQQPGIAETVNFDHIKRHYYYTHAEINPTRIVPLGPELDLTGPHLRAAF